MVMWETVQEASKLLNEHLISLFLVQNEYIEWSRSEEPNYDWSHSRHWYIDIHVHIMQLVISMTQQQQQLINSFFFFRRQTIVEDPVGPVTGFT